MTHTSTNQIKRAVALSSAAAAAGLLLLLGSTSAYALPPDCLGNSATIVRGAGSQTIVGTPGDDVIVAGSGNDVIRGLGGADTICGGSGKDQVHGGEGDDYILGETGNDLLDGGAGSDHVVGDVATDGPTDPLTARAGKDNIFGGDEGSSPASDILIGDNASQTASRVSGAAPDTIRGGVGGGEIYGDSAAGSGIAQGGAADKISSSASDDPAVALVFGDGAGQTGAVGCGSDRIRVKLTYVVVMADATTRTGDARGACKDAISATTSMGATVLSDPYTESGDAVGSAPDRITTGSGPDFVSADSYAVSGSASGSAADLIRTGAGDDSIWGDHGSTPSTGGGRDKIFAGGGADTIYGGPMRDLCDGGAGSSDQAFECEITLGIP